jgi:hypothetical protein
MVVEQTYIMDMNERFGNSQGGSFWSNVGSLLMGLVEETKNDTDIKIAGLSCINSYHKPSKTEKNLVEKIAPWFNDRLIALGSVEEKQRLMQLQEIMRYAKGGRWATLSTRAESKWRNCSRHALKMYANWYDATYDSLVAQRNVIVQSLESQGYNLNQVSHTLETRKWDVGDKPNTYQGDIGLNAYGANYDKYPTFQVNEYEVGTQSLGGDITGTIGTITGGVKKASVSMIGLLVLIPTAIYWFFFKDKKKSKKQKKYGQKRW